MCTSCNCTASQESDARCLVLPGFTHTAWVHVAHLFVCNNLHAKDVHRYVCAACNQLYNGYEKRFGTKRVESSSITATYVCWSLSTVATVSLQVAFTIIYYNISQSDMTDKVQQQCVNETAPFLAVSPDHLIISSISKYSASLGRR